MKYADNEIERAVLGSMLRDNSIIVNVGNYLQAECFSVESNRRIFTTMIDINAEKMPVDIMSLFARRCAEAEYIAGLTDVVPSGANWEFYAHSVKAMYIARELEEQARSIVSRLEIAFGTKEFNEMVTEVIETSTREMTSLSDRFGASTKVKMIRDVMPRVCDRLDYAVKHPGELLGMDSGLNNLNHFTSGIQNEYIVIGARPSMGKTALGVQLGLSLAKKKNKGVLFQLEMMDEAVVLRMVSSESGINNQLIKAGLIREGNALNKVLGAMEGLAELPFAIEDRICEIHDIAARIRYLVRCEGFKWAMIDHISCIEHRDSKLPRHEQVAKISRILANLSHELKIPVIALAQLTRTAEGKAPSLAELGESKAIEQDADTVMFLHRDREEESDAIPTDLIISKQRDGAIGRAKLLFMPKTTKFVDLIESGKK